MNAKHILAVPIAAIASMGMAAAAHAVSPPPSQCGSCAAASANVATDSRGGRAGTDGSTSAGRHDLVGTVARKLEIGVRPSHSTRGIPLDRPIVGVQVEGSTGGIPLFRPVVGIQGDGTAGTPARASVVIAVAAGR